MGFLGSRMEMNHCKYVYLSMFVVSTVVSWVLRDFGTETLDGLSSLDGCQGNSSCLGKEAVLRISCGSAIFFFLISAATICVVEEDDPREIFHSGLWLFKFPLWVGLICSFFFIPGNFAEVYFQIARVGGTIYLVLQAVILLDVIYVWNEEWLERKFLMVMLVVLTAALYSASLVGIGFMYDLFAPRASCSLNIFFITFTLILGLVYTSISVTPWRVQSAGLFTSSAVFGYSVFLTWSSIMSQPPEDTCNTLQRTEGDTGWTTIVGFVITMLSVILVTYRAGGRHKAFGLRESASEFHDGISYRPDFFHLIFMLASMMVAMILTGWSDSWENEQFVVDESWVSAWMKIATLWLIDLLYIWSMIAHLILKDREF